MVKMYADKDEVLGGRDGCATSSVKASPSGFGVHASACSLAVEVATDKLKLELQTQSNHMSHLVNSCESHRVKPSQTNFMRLSDLTGKNCPSAGQLVNRKSRIENPEGGDG